MWPSPRTCHAPSPPGVLSGTNTSLPEAWTRKSPRGREVTGAGAPTWLSQPCCLSRRLGTSAGLPRVPRVLRPVLPVGRAPQPFQNLPAGRLRAWSAEACASPSPLGGHSRGGDIPPSSRVLGPLPRARCLCLLGPARVTANSKRLANGSVPWKTEAVLPVWLLDSGPLGLSGRAGRQRP